jgi:hypothetical protein
MKILMEGMIRPKELTFPLNTIDTFSACLITFVWRFILDIPWFGIIVIE